MFLFSFHNTGFIYSLGSHCSFLSLCVKSKFVWVVVVVWKTSFPINGRDQLKNDWCKRKWQFSLCRWIWGLTGCSRALSLCLLSAKLNNDSSCSNDSTDFDEQIEEKGSKITSRAALRCCKIFIFFFSITGNGKPYEATDAGQRLTDETFSRLTRITATANEGYCPTLLSRNWHWR